MFSQVNGILKKLLIKIELTMIVLTVVSKHD